MKYLREIDPEVFKAIIDEQKREDEQIELIASENFTHPAVLEAQGSVMTNKYAEGYPAARWYGGCEYVDVVESLAIKRAKEVFNTDYHVNVQPHSGTQANMAVYFSILKPKDTMLAMDLACGGHLSHGHPKNFSGSLYNIVSYGVNKKTEMLDYDEIRNLAIENKPKMILAGASAYPRKINFEKLSQICKEVKAFFVVDMAHIAGLIAAGLHPNPFGYADFVTTTTHKTLRGPRGGVIFCRPEFSRKIDSMVFPGTQGGPLMHVIAAKAVAFKQALSPEFKEYQLQIIKNIKAMIKEFKNRNYRIVSGDSDNHLLLLDLTSINLSGKEATDILGRVNITVNKNLIPYDKKSPFITSGIRIGTPAITSRGMKEPQMKDIVNYIDEALINKANEQKLSEVKQKVKELVESFPLYKELR